MNEPPSSCPNCGTDLQGRFCYWCGQKATSTQVGLHDFVHEATHEFLHLDGKILRTVKLLVLRPGQLTKEFLEGRRARYISPLRVYLTLSVLFFALAAIVPGAMKGVVKVKTTASADAPAPSRIGEGLRKAEQDPEQLGQKVMHDLPRAMFVLMPVFGLLTWAFYRTQQPYYIPHLYYSVHLHAFAFLMMSLYVVAAWLLPKPLAALLLLTAVPYHFIALRRVFGGSRAMTFAKGFAIGAIYWILATTALLLVAFWVMMQL